MKKNEIKITEEQIQNVINFMYKMQEQQDKSFSERKDAKAAFYGGTANGIMFVLDTFGIER